MLHKDRLFPTDLNSRAIAQRLFETVEKLPLICPHGHTEPQWFSKNEKFVDPAQLLIVPDHYVLRMLVSQGVSLKALGIAQANHDDHEKDGRAIWRLFAKHYYLFAATPVRLWFDYTLSELFGVTERLTEKNAGAIYDQISACLAQEAFRPRALFERFNIELLATTDACTDGLAEHSNIAQSDWSGRVIPTYRPDAAIDPDHKDFSKNLELLANQTGEDTTDWQGYLNAHRARRAFFKAQGATATDHGHPTARTADLSLAACEALFTKILSGKVDTNDKENFRAQMLMEMAGMSIEDGLVMQLHAGSLRNHNRAVFDSFGPDKGFDIPRAINFADDLRPLLNKYGMDKRLSLILFTLDETTYARELAPMAGVYPSVKVGPAWWFHDSPEGMMRYRQMITETAGFYNTSGFNDDTRAFPSIPARHDVARRVDCAFLAGQVARHIISEEEAINIAYELAYGLAKRAYNL